MNSPTTQPSMPVITEQTLQAFGPLDTPARRLRALALARFRNSLSKCAKALNIPGPTFLAHCNGTRNIVINEGQAGFKYPSFFGTTAEWIMFGAGPAFPAQSARPQGGHPLLLKLRTVLGFSSDAEAAHFFGLDATLYRQHETGTLPVSEEFKAVYVAGVTRYLKEYL